VALPPRPWAPGAAFRRAGLVCKRSLAVRVLRCFCSRILITQVPECSSRSSVRRAGGLLRRFWSRDRVAGLRCRSRRSRWFLILGRPNEVGGYDTDVQAQKGAAGKREPFAQSREENEVEVRNGEFQKGLPPAGPGPLLVLQVIHLALRMVG